MQKNVLDYVDFGMNLEFKETPFVIQAEKTLSRVDLEKTSLLFAQVIEKKVSGMTRMPIAVFLPKCAETIVADLAIVLTGNIFTNLDIKSPRDRMTNLVNNVKPALIVTSKEFLGELNEFNLEDIEVVTIDLNSLLKSEEINYTLPIQCIESVDTDPVCIINTSGSTGVPKSVVLNHRSIIDFIDWCTTEFQFDEGEVFGSLSPLYFDIYILELFVALAKNCTLTLIPESLAAFPNEILTFLSRESVTFIFWVPTVMVNIANLDLLSKVTLPALKRIFFAGEVFPTKPLNYWRKMLPNRQFVNLYGPIEITVDCTFFIVDREFRDDEPIPIGSACSNTKILILNESDLECKVGEIGELCIGGSSLAMGYYNNPEQTAKRFVQNPLNKNYPETIYKTGDLVYMNNENEIMYVGRSDFQVKHFGYRIELSEIENASLLVPGVKNACCLYDHELKQIVLIYEAEKELPVLDFRTTMLQKVPKYMLPSIWHRISEMPRNPNGKIDRNGLSSNFLSSQ